MSITVQDNQGSGSSGATGRTQALIQFFDVSSNQISTYPLIVGNKIVFYDITDRTNIVAYLTVDLSTNTGVEPTAVNQIAPRVYIRRGGTGGFLSVANYNTGGNCYVQSYDVVGDGTTGRVASFTPIGDDGSGHLGWYSLGSGAANGEVNQAIESGYVTDSGANNSIGVIFNSDIKFLTLNPAVGPVVVGTIAAGGTLWGIAVMDDSNASVNYIYATEGGNLHCWTVSGSGSLTATPIFTVAVGDEARNVYAIPYNNASIPFQTTYVAVIAVDAGVSFVRFYDSLVGTFLGEYQCQTADTITDAVFTVNDSFLPTCMFAVTDGSADNVQTVDISDITAPVFRDSQSVGAYPQYSIFSLFGDTAVTLGGVNGSEGSLITGVTGGCTGGGGTHTYTDCFILGDSLLTVSKDDDEFKVFNVADPSTPTPLTALALASSPRAVWAYHGLAYVACSNGNILTINIDDPNAPSLIATTTAGGESWQFIEGMGNTILLSGADASGIALYQLDEQQPTEPPLYKEMLPSPSDVGTSGFDIQGRRLYFADSTSADDNCILYSYRIGGFRCDFIDTGALHADEVKAETVRGRNGYFKGDLAATSLTLYGSSTETAAGILTVANYINIGGRYILYGSGNPNGVVTAPISSLFLSDDGTDWRNTDGATAWSSI